MKVSYSRETNSYTIKKEDAILESSIIKLDMCDRRKEILFEWASEQIEFINQKQIRSIVGAFFAYKIVPTSVGSEITVICLANGKELDLSLIDDEAW